MTESHEENRLSLRSKVLLVIVVLVGVILPLQFWYTVWFGRELADEELARYLASVEHPREVQHALAQIEEGIRSGDSDVAKWYPRLAALSEHPSPIVRNQAAWVMGQDGKAEVFHAALTRLVQDEVGLVRRNAALALARFGDREAALPVLREMLRPVVLTAPTAGEVTLWARLGDELQPGSRVAEVAGQGVTAALPGRVEWLFDGAGEIAEGAQLARLSPDPQSVWEALRALYLVGEREDLALVESIEGDSGLTEPIRAQAKYTRQAILAR